MKNDVGKCLLNEISICFDAQTCICIHLHAHPQKVVLAGGCQGGIAT